jgi:hypothetical protein
MNELESLVKDQATATVSNNMLFTNAIKEVYNTLCNSNQWGVVDEVEIRNSHARYVYNKIRRFTNGWSNNNELLEITINLKPGVEYCPKWYRRICLNDYYASGDERDLEFNNHDTCVLYEFITDVPEYYNYDYEVADSITITYGDRELTITGEHIKSSYDILRIMNKELQLTF